MGTKKKTAVAPRKTRQQYKIDDKELVMAWQTAHSVAEVEKALGVPTGIINSRVMTMRKKGVPLKPMRKRGRFTADYINELSVLADSLNHESE